MLLTQHKRMAMLIIDMNPKTDLQKTIMVTFKDPSLLEQALTHSSYVNENPGLAPVSNERLEFLGDAVLGLIVAVNLYQAFPHLSEGDMTRLRSELVRQDTLARVAETIGLGDYLYLGKGEEAGGGRHKPANLARAFEALVAAIFLDSGLSVASDLVTRLLEDEQQAVIGQGKNIDYKSQLQELLQAGGQPSPTYEVIAAIGPDHSKTFTVEAKLGETVLARGSGKSKKLAESEAARAALEKLATSFTP